ncbi:uncharacterized protein AB675_11566 [Cyphellophora attinorum]|uniref:LITAF domain-containing protein n=1 Tax=Cyphellophora attinorum TaxID=1664694 RepID=A0A0N1H988_9EURO|nr:uncharacterized protein AB675_11566 [Phialophora attinorum]KPI40095.1 hypothetical protein AB675_11566 [Phialophora attinorum]
MSTYAPNYAPTPQQSQPQGVQSMTYSSPDQINQQQQHNEPSSYTNEKAVQPSQSQTQQPQAPPSYGYQQAPIVSGVTPLNQLDEFETTVDCPYCHYRARTRIVKDSSAITILVGIGIGCFCICLSCLPCILHWFPDVHHYCSNCNKRLATVKQSGGIKVYEVVPTGMPAAPGGQAPIPMQPPVNTNVTVQKPQEAVVRGS